LGAAQAPAQRRARHGTRPNEQGGGMRLAPAPRPSRRFRRRPADQKADGACRLSGEGKGCENTGTRPNSGRPVTRYFSNRDVHPAGRRRRSAVGPGQGDLVGGPISTFRSCSAHDQAPPVVTRISGRQMLAVDRAHDPRARREEAPARPLTTMARQQPAGPTAARLKPQANRPSSRAPVPA